MIINMLNIIISRIKKSKYELDNNLTIFDIIIIIKEKFINYMLGMIKTIGIKGKKKHVFVGKKVKISHRNHIIMGSGVQIKDYVEINGLSKEGIVLGNNSSIGKFTIIRGSGILSNLGKGLIVGENFGCGDFCFFGCSGGIRIGHNVIIGQNVRFHSQNHKYNRLDVPIKEQGVISKGIEVGNDCWIGSGATILDGVKIGNGCVIGANTLVNKNIPDFSVVVGNPAKIVKNRKESRRGDFIYESK